MRGGLLPGSSVSAKAELVTAQHAIKAIRVIFMVQGSLERMENAVSDRRKMAVLIGKSDN
jgi:hypothetical protein